MEKTHTTVRGQGPNYPQRGNPGRTRDSAARHQGGPSPQGRAGDTQHPRDPRSPELGDVARPAADSFRVSDPSEEQISRTNMRTALVGRTTASEPRAASMHVDPCEMKCGKCGSAESEHPCGFPADRKCGTQCGKCGKPGSPPSANIRSSADRIPDARRVGDDRLPGLADLVSGAQRHRRAKNCPPRPRRAGVHSSTSPRIEERTR